MYGSRPSTASTRPTSRGGVLPGAHKPRVKESESVDTILSHTACDGERPSSCWSERRVHGQVVDPVLESELMALLRRHDAKWTRLATPESAGRRSPERPGWGWGGAEASPADLSGASTDLEASRLAETPEGRRALIGLASGPPSRLGTPASAQLGGRAASPEDPKLAYRRELDEQIRIKRELQQQQQQQQRQGTPRDGGRAPAHSSVVQPPFALVDEPPRTGSRAAARGVALPPFALNDGPAAPASERQSEVSEAARRIKTMHWGEGDVSRWHEKEARLAQYREDLARQVAEKRGREAPRPATPADVWVADSTAEDAPPAFPPPHHEDSCGDAARVLALCRAHGAFAPDDGDATPHYGASPRGDASALYGSDPHAFRSDAAAQYGSELHAYSDPHGYDAYGSAATPQQYDGGAATPQYDGSRQGRGAASAAGSVCSEEYGAVMQRVGELAGEVERQRQLIENLQRRPPLSTRAQARSRPLHEPRKVTAKVADRAPKEPASRPVSGRRSAAARRL